MYRAAQEELFMGFPVALRKETSYDVVAAWAASD